MGRKILAGSLLFLSSVLLVASLMGIGLIWINREPVTQTALTRLGAIDAELAQAQSALSEAKTELERTLEIVAAAEKTLATLKDDLARAKLLFGKVETSLEQQLVPVLRRSRAQINQAVTVLTDTRASLERINALPFVDFSLPGEELLTGLRSSAATLETQIAQMEALSTQAETFLKDTSSLTGGDLTQTRENLRSFLAVVNAYETKVTDWRAQIADLTASLPGWIDSLSVVSTIFLLWFAFSQAGLCLHGLNLWRNRLPRPGTTATP